MSLYNGVMYAAPPPPGVTPDMNVPYKAVDLLAVIGVFLPITAAVLGIRIWSRLSLKGKFALDDYIMIVAFMLGVVMIGFVLDMLRWGLGKHIWDVPLDHLMPHWSFDNVMAAIFFCAATGFAKGSILLFYLRIFPTRRMQWAVWLSFGFVIGFSGASVLVNILSCKPVSGSWDLEVSMTARCINRPVFYFAQAGLGIFADILTVVLPLPMLRTLQLPIKQKIGVGIVLTVGGFVCVVSIIRLQSLEVLLTDADLTKNTTSALAWCVVELLLSIIGGSIPALKPFIRRFFPTILGTSRAARRGLGRSDRVGDVGGGAGGGAGKSGSGSGSSGAGDGHAYNYFISASRRVSSPWYGLGYYKKRSSRLRVSPDADYILETVSVKVTSSSAAGDGAGCCCCCCCGSRSGGAGGAGGQVTIPGSSCGCGAVGVIGGLNRDGSLPSPRSMVDLRQHDSNASEDNIFQPANYYYRPPTGCGINSKKCCEGADKIHHHHHHQHHECPHQNGDGRRRHSHHHHRPLGHEFVVQGPTRTPSPPPLPPMPPAAAVRDADRRDWERAGWEL